MAAYGLYTHIRTNQRRSIALLIGLFFLVYLLVYAGALVGEAVGSAEPVNALMRRALADALYASPFATAGTALLKKRRAAAILFSRSESSLWSC